jgi:ABC-type antimicrobial peptide transport system permease subunit
MDLVVRSSLPTDRIAGAVATALQELDPAMPVREFWTVESTVDRALSPRRFTLGVITVYGAVALLLATLGIYGVLAQAVAERTEEIGIRVAMGARGGQVMAMILRQGLLMVGAGVVLGLGLGMALSRVLESQLYQISARDPLALVGAPLLVAAVAMAATSWQAGRATRIDPVRALHAD